jgi:predicted negative regulator of RcsB-dependent stress response
MKAQQRKELHTNALADWLGRFAQTVQSVKEGPSTMVLVVGGVLLAIACGVVGWMWYDRHAKQQTSAENRDLDQAQSREDYKKIADAHANTPAGRVARLQLARLSLKEGLDQLYASSADDREQARKSLEDARSYYANLVRDCRDAPILAEECLMGQAKAQESLGDLEGALATYQSVVAQHKDGALAGEAEERVKFLEDPDNRKKLAEFYQKLNALAESKPIFPPTVK